MKKLLYIPASLLLSLAAVTSCDDDVTTTGSALITDKAEVVIDTAFTPIAHSIEVTSVPSRTTTQLIGRLEADGFGFLSSEIVTQFMPSMTLDTVGTSADDIISMEMLMFFTTGEFTGDSITPMGLKVYPLTKTLPSPIYSDFDVSGYYNENDAWENKVYTGNALYNDSLSSLSYRTIRVAFPLDFAKKFYNEYITNPSTFASPQAFAKFFPGIYIQNSFGEGRVTNIRESRINMSYHRHATYMKDSVERDTMYTINKTYMAVTPEVITNNIIKFDINSRLKAMAEEGKSLLVAPVGYNVELRFPLPEVIKSYKDNAGKLAVINQLSMTIPAEKIANDYGIEAPNQVLMVLKKDMADFFAKRKLTDDKTSFLATYNETTKSYDFSAMRQYLIDMMAKEEELTADDYTFILTPVNVETEETEANYYQPGAVYVTSIAPYVSGPTMVMLDIDKTKIKLIYGKQSIEL